MTRGISLNNPGNIRHGKDTWQGMSADQPDESFIKFDKPVYGIRAIARILLNYERKGFDTVDEIISRWAPPSENDTSSYVLHVADALGVTEATVLDLDTVAVMLPLVKAIITHENGVQPYKDDVLMAALVLAGVADVPKPKLSAKVVSKVVAGTGVGLGLLNQVAEPAKTVADGLSGFTSAPIIQWLVTAALTIAGIAVLSGIAKTWLDHLKGI